MRHRAFATALIALLLSACGGESSITAPQLPTKLKVVAAIGTDATTGASIETDLDDYAPGGAVNLVGRGWAPNETIHLVMTEDPDTHADVIRDVQSDDAGTFTIQFYEVQESDVGVRFTLTGTGATSGSTVTVQFTDGRNISAIVPSPASPVAGTSVTTAVSVILNNGTGPQNWDGTKWEIRNSSNVVVATSPAPCLDTPDHTLGDADETNGNKHQESFTFTAPAAGTYTLTVSVYSTDNCASASDATTQSVAFTTTGSTNTPPVLSAIGNKSANELTELTFTATATDDGLPAPPALTFSLANPSSGTFPTGAAITADGGFAWTPTELQGPGTYRVKVVVSDGSLTDEEEIEITVNEVNVSPVLTVPADVVTQWGVALGDLSATATDADIPANTLTFSKVSGPSWVTVAANGTISFGSITASDVGVHTVRVRVEDNGSPVMGDEEEFKITVQNRPTQLTYDGRTSGQYSDVSTLSATLLDNGAGSPSGAALVGKIVDFYFDGVKVGSGTTDAAGKATYDYTIPSAANTYSVQAKYAGDGGYDGSNSALTSFAVARENAEGSTISNGGAAQVGAKSFTVTVGIKEARLGNGDEPYPNDGQLPGSIANVPSLTAVASPVSGGSNVAGSCAAGSVSGSGYGAVRSFSCTFGDGVTQLPVDVYTLTFTVGGNYYTGTYEDVFSIWDPSAGFATGGGSFMLDGDRVSFGFSFTMTKNKSTPRGGVVVVRHLAGGGVCRAKSNSMDAPAVVGNAVTLGGKGNYNCVVNNVTTISQGNLNLIVVGEDWATSGAGADKFRVKAMDQLDMATTVALATGNIQVPQPGK